ncbi:MAG TPA: autotransporter domain-containing protein [Hypericibacter adhaerens]|uniref:autotransporter domain-containing protein n=1 Tax=Hypericibacter adhaerens TaxID=2602016 RepID=UPI002B800540|nr:autotransporter domain-containing protein [Hypericibacter adhaerens]HWA42607.1 autotransporter domain-containing protein [Hypericibacter adhaerens]
MLAIMGLAAMALPLQAADWTGGTSTDWSDPANWNPATAPDSSTDTVIDSAPLPNAPTVSTAGAAAHGVVIGNGATDAGALTIDGAGQLQVSGGSLTVGEAGSGTLTVSAGGLLTTGDASIAHQLGSTGTVTIMGLGSLWDMSAGALRLGEGGSGSLTVTGGGELTAASFTGSHSSTVTVESGSQLTVTNAFDFGAAGIGNILSVEGGSAFTTGSATFAPALGAVSTVAIEGTGTTWDAANLAVGGAGTASVTVSDHATVTVPGDIIVDGTGDAGLTISTQASVTQGLGPVGNDAGTGDFRIGNSADGSLTIDSGGSLSSRFSLVGSDAGSHGTVTLDGAGSSWTARGPLEIGSAGSGTLDITNGASLVTEQGADLAFSNGSEGHVTITGTGSSWQSGSQITVGLGGLGTLDIEADADVSAVGMDVGSNFLFNGAAAGTGEVTVTGAGTTLNLNVETFQALHVGDDGSTGTLDILDGAVVTVRGSGTIADSVLYNGQTFHGEGTVTVDGTGSALSYTSTLDVGARGTGTLNIKNGGHVTNGSVYIGSYQSSDTIQGVGTVNLDGATSLWTTNGTMRVGDQGIGTFTITGGGVATDTNGIIAGSTNARGDVTINGANSRWSSTNNLTIGSSGIATLTLEDGGAATAGGTVAINSRSTLNIGSGGAAGTLTAATVNNAGQIHFDHTGTTSFTAAIAGAGTLVKDGTGTTTLTGTSSYTGATSVNAGKLVVDGSLGNTAVTVASGATLGGAGTIGGTVTIDSGAHLAPGDSPETLTINGDLLLNAGSILDYELGLAGTVGGGVNDLIAVGGNLTLDGTLNVADVGGFGMGVYTLMTYGGTLTDNGLAVGTVPDADRDYTVLAGSGTVTLTVGGPATQFWDGPNTSDNGAVDGGTSIWSAAPTQWTTPDGTTNGAWGGKFAVFQGTAGTVTVQGPLTFTGMQFRSDGYEIAAGTGALLTTDTAQTSMRVDTGVTAEISVEIAGTGGLVKRDAGTLILSAANSYDGGTTVEGGQLTAAVTGALGDGPADVTGAGSILLFDDPGVGPASAEALSITTEDGGALQFRNGTAGTATIENDGGQTDFFDSATAADATITNDTGGSTFFHDTATADDATIVNNAGGVVDISDLSAAGIGIGSLSGGGNVFLGGKTLTIGSLDRSETISGVIADGGANGGTGGALIKTGTGILTLSGANSYTGGTEIDDGTLRLAASNRLATTGALTVDAGGEFDLAGFNQTVGDLAGAGAIALGNGQFTAGGAADTSFDGVISGSGSFIKQGVGALTVSGLNDYTGGTTVGAGTLRLDGNDRLATTGALAILSGGTFDLDGFDQTVGDLSGAGILALGSGQLTAGTANNATFSGTISGSGDLVKQGTGRFVLTGTSSGYTGDTEVSAGALIVNGDIGNSPVTVDAGALLGGGGTVGATDIAGTIAPGNSIGTLTVTGNYDQQSGSTYEVEIDPSGASDLVHATGSATIDPNTTVNVTGPSGAYTVGTRYTILTADLGVTGQYGTLTDNLPFLVFQLNSDATNIFLDISQSTVAFTDIAGTRNQRATASGLQDLSAGDPVFDALLGLSDADARAAFDRLSGEIHTTTKGILLEQSRYLRDAVLDRAGAPFSDPDRPVLVSSRSVSLRLAESDAPGTPETGPALAAWAQGFGSWMERDGDGNAASADASTGGFVAGLDATFDQTWRVGLAGGYSNSGVNEDQRDSRASVDSFHIAAYGGLEIDNFGVRLGGAYSWNDVESHRSVAFPGFSDSARADYDSRTAQLFGEVAYDVAIDRLAIEPFANLAYVNLDTDGFTETGSAALTAKDESDDNLFSTLGLRLSSRFELGESLELVAHGMVGWRHAFGGTTPSSDFSLAGGPGTPFTIDGTPMAEDAAVIEAGADLNIGPDVTLGLSYSGQIAGEAQDNGLRGSLTLHF